MKNVGNSGEALTRVGERFGDAVVGLIRSLRAYVVTVDSIDETRGVAMVTFFDNSTSFPVPLTLLQSPTGMLTIRPAVDSTAVISFMNGDENMPFFVAVTTVDEFKCVVGESSIRVTDGLIEMNGGTLNGLVAIDKLTERLNKLQSEVAAIVNVLNSHAHPYTWTRTDGAGVTSPPTNSASAPSAFQNSDYENPKITQ